MSNPNLSLTQVLLLGYTTCTTIAAHYGFGQDMWAIPLPDLPPAIMWEAIGQCFAVIGMALAKWSLGLFLLRLVNQAWHKISIWLVMGALMCASVSTCFVFMLQCSPPQYLWDRSIPGGHCDLNATPVSLTLTGELFIFSRSVTSCRLWQRGKGVSLAGFPDRADEGSKRADNGGKKTTVVCVIADLFFALMPWIFLWHLNMNQREKMIIAISMSLGVM